MAARTTDEIYDLLLASAGILADFCSYDVSGTVEGGAPRINEVLATGRYTWKGEIAHGRPVFKNYDSAFSLWYDGVSRWYISPAVDDVSAYFRKLVATPTQGESSATYTKKPSSLADGDCIIAKNLHWDEVLPMISDQPATGAAHTIGGVLNSIDGMAVDGVLKADALVNGGSASEVAAAVAANASIAALIGIQNGSSVITEAALAAAPTGTTVVYSLGGVTAIGAMTPIPLVAQRYSAFSLPVPVLTNQAGKQHRFTVVSQKRKATVLFTLDYTHCTPGTNSGGAYIVTVADTDQYTQNLQDGYWYLHNITDNLRVGEGIWTVQDGPNFGS